MVVRCVTQLRRMKLCVRGAVGGVTGLTQGQWWCKLQQQERQQQDEHKACLLHSDTFKLPYRHAGCESRQVPP